MEFYIHPDIKEAFFRARALDVPPEIEGVKVIEREIAFWQSAGYDYVPLELSLRSHPHGMAGTQQAALRGSLFLDYTKSRGSSGWLETVTGAIGDLDELERFPWPDPDEVDYSPIERAAQALPNTMKLIIQPGRMFQAVWGYLGFTRFCEALADDTSLVGRMFERCCSLQVEVVRRAVDMDGVGGVWIGDDIAFSTGLVVPPETLHEHYYPWVRKIGAICRSRDLPFVFHSDGDITEALDALIDAGVHAIHPLEPGAMDITDTKRRVEGQLCLIGNIDLDFPLTRGSPKDVGKAVHRRIQETAPGGGFCIGSANSIPSFIPIANYEALRLESLRVGVYPITRPEEE